MKVIIRGRGQSVGGAGDKMSDPVLQLYHQGSPVSGGYNDDWENLSSLDLQFLAEKGLDNGLHYHDAVLVMTLNAGAYVAHVYDPGATQTKMAIVEVFEFDTTGNRKLKNISTKAYTTGSAPYQQIAGGFIIEGGTNTVVLRGRGQSVGGAGNKIQDPVIQLYKDGNPYLDGYNDNWGSLSYADKQYLASVGLDNGLHSNDAVLVLDLPAGAWVAHVYDWDGQSGMGMVEIFDTPNRE